MEVMFRQQGGQTGMFACRFRNISNFFLHMHTCTDSRMIEQPWMMNLCLRRNRQGGRKSHVERSHNINNEPYCWHLGKMGKRLSTRISLSPVFPRLFLLRLLSGTVFWTVWAGEAWRLIMSSLKVGFKLHKLLWVYLAKHLPLWSHRWQVKIKRASPPFFLHFFTSLWNASQKAEGSPQVYLPNLQPAVQHQKSRKMKLVEWSRHEKKTLF